MFGAIRDTGLIRSALITVALVAVGAVLMIEFGPNNTIGVMGIKVVNDTTRTVKIQPCWDLDCLNRIGLRTTVIPPHKARRIAGKWANDFAQEIAIAILKPAAEWPHSDGCIVNLFPPRVKVGVFRVSHEGPCLMVPEGGSVG